MALDVKKPGLAGLDGFGRERRVGFEARPNILNYGLVRTSSTQKDLNKYF